MSTLEHYKTPLLILLGLCCLVALLYCVRLCYRMDDRCCQIENAVRHHDGVLQQLLQPQTILRRPQPQPPVPTPVIEEDDQDDLDDELQEELQRIRQEPKLETIPEEEPQEISESLSPSRAVVEEVPSP